MSSAFRSANNEHTLDSPLPDGLTAHLLHRAGSPRALNSLQWSPSQTKSWRVSLYLKWRCVSRFHCCRPLASPSLIVSLMSSKSVLRLGTHLHSQRLPSRLYCQPVPAFFTGPLTLPKRSFTASRMTQEQNGVNPKKTGDKEDTHNGQAGTTTHREEDQWKHREPYAIHDHSRNDKFDVKWEGTCHCGKVTYELSREKPLAAKYCHCTTCQRLHGVSTNVYACKAGTQADREHSHPSNGPPSSTNPTSTSPTDTTTSAGTIPPQNPRPTTFPAKSPARTAAPPSWTKAVT